MDDAEYIYKQDVKEKAITARSSHKYGSSRRRRCGLSSDNLTRKEWERMRGSFLGQVQSFAEELAAGLYQAYPLEV